MANIEAIIVDGVRYDRVQAKTEYVCAEFSRKADAKRYIKEERYDTPSRVHIIREE